MSYSLQLISGDINVSGPGGFSVITGQQKLLQDLRCALLEPRGTDPLHPEYGSNLDGGMLPDGSFVEPVIGGLATAEQLLSIEAEVRRILANYQQQQTDRMNRDVILYAGKNTLGLGEILASINAVDVQQIATTLVVRISLQTANGDSLTFSQPIS